MTEIDPNLPVFRIKHLDRGDAVKGLSITDSGFYAVADNRPIMFGPYDDPIDAGRAARQYCLDNAPYNPELTK